MRKRGADLIGTFEKSVTFRSALGKPKGSVMPKKTGADNGDILGHNQD